MATLTPHNKDGGELFHQALQKGKKNMPENYRPVSAMAASVSVIKRVGRGWEEDRVVHLQGCQVEFAENSIHGG